MQDRISFIILFHSDHNMIRLAEYIPVESFSRSWSPQNEERDREMAWKYLTQRCSRNLFRACIVESVSDAETALPGSALVATASGVN